MWLFLAGLSGIPSRPALKPPALPVKLAGGLFLFATSVPQERKTECEQLQKLAESALRSDPRITMELGMGIEAGGVFASASSSDACVVNFQINGGNAWAECTAFGAKCADGIELLDVTVSNMDAAMTGTMTGGGAIQVALPQQQEGKSLSGSTPQEEQMAKAMAAARAEAGIDQPEVEQEAAVEDEES
jgi:hypothetical protein